MDRKKKSKFDGNIAQSTAYREKKDSKPPELSTEMIMNFVDAQHNLHLHTRSPKDQREEVSTVYSKIISLYILTCRGN